MKCHERRSPGERFWTKIRVSACLALGSIIFSCMKVHLDRSHIQSSQYGSKQFMNCTKYSLSVYCVWIDMCKIFYCKQLYCFIARPLKCPCGYLVPASSINNRWTPVDSWKVTWAISKVCQTLGNLFGQEHISLSLCARNLPIKILFTHS